MRRPVPAPLAALPLVALLVLAAGCDGNTEVTTAGRGALAVACETAGATLPSGSPTPLPVVFRVTRGGSVAAGESVVFTASAGDVTPDVASSAADGTATAAFFAPAAAGNVLVTARVTNPGEEAFATCTVGVMGTTNPRVSVSVTSPAQLAGLTVRVGYDSSILALALPGVEAVGPLATAGCVSQTTDAAGVATLLQACPDQRAVAGSEVARFTFANSGPVQTAGDFAVTCEGVDELGRQVATFCAVTVAQL